MIATTLIMEDSILIGHVDAPNQWRGTVTDALSGKSQEFCWTFDQFGAVISLMLNPNLPGHDELYKIAEPLFTDWPIEVRPIP